MAAIFMSKTISQTQKRSSKMLSLNPFQIVMTIMMTVRIENLTMQNSTKQMAKPSTLAPLETIRLNQRQAAINSHRGNRAKQGMKLYKKGCPLSSTKRKIIKKKESIFSKRVIMLTLPKLQQRYFQLNVFSISQKTVFLSSAQTCASLRLYLCRMQLISSKKSPPLHQSPDPVPTHMRPSSFTPNDCSRLSVLKTKKSYFLGSILNLPSIPRVPTSGCQRKHCKRGSFQNIFQRCLNIGMG